MAADWSDSLSTGQATFRLAKLPVDWPGCLYPYGALQNLDNLEKRNLASLNNHNLRLS